MVLSKYLKNDKTHAIANLCLRSERFSVLVFNIGQRLYGNGTMNAEINGLLFQFPVGKLEILLPVV